MDNLLPIGSVIEMDNKLLLICGYLKKDNLIDGKKYDYICGYYPTGVQEKPILVQKEHIERIRFIGYQDQSYFKFISKFQKENK